MFQYPKKKKRFALLCSEIAGILMTKDSVVESDPWDKLGNELQRHQCEELKRLTFLMLTQNKHFPHRLNHFSFDLLTC